jgi:endonuclease YncB( thermonuclease family)
MFAGPLWSYTVSRKHWRFEAKVERVVDGDTIDLEVTLRNLDHMVSIPVPGPAHSVEAAPAIEQIIDLGFRTYLVTRIEGGQASTSIVVRQRFRLLGVNTPEVYGIKKEDRGPGLAASAWVKERVKEGDRVAIESKRTGKYGRWLVTVWTAGELLPGGRPIELLLEEHSLNQAIIKAGHGDPA